MTCLLNIGTLKGTQAKNDIQKDARPKFVHARPIAYALLSKVDKKLERLQEQGVIEPVKFSEFATPIVPVLNSYEEVRLCGDFKVTGI